LKKTIFKIKLHIGFLICAFGTHIKVTSTLIISNGGFVLKVEDKLLKMKGI